MLHRFMYLEIAGEKTGQLNRGIKVMIVLYLFRAINRNKWKPIVPDS